MSIQNSHTPPPQSTVQHTYTFSSEISSFFCVWEEWFLVVPPLLTTCAETFCGRNFPREYYRYLHVTFVKILAPFLTSARDGLCSMAVLHDTRFSEYLCEFKIPSLVLRCAKVLIWKQSNQNKKFDQQNKAWLIHLIHIQIASTYSEHWTSLKTSKTYWQPWKSTAREATPTPTAVAVTSCPRCLLAWASASATAAWVTGTSTRTSRLPARPRTIKTWPTPTGATSATTTWTTWQEWTSGDHSEPPSSTTGTYWEGCNTNSYFLLCGCF